MPGEIINDIQRELARRGYYEGAIDGLYGPRTDAAIRDFEQAAGLKPSAEPNEALLQAIVRAPAKLAKVAAPPAPAPRPPAPIRRGRDREAGAVKTRDCAAARACRLWLRSDQAERDRRRQPRPRSRNSSASASCPSLASHPTGSRASFRR
jgi:peptidoglycan hydrolase-like protein with peptidoglycan-binding domain